MRTELRFQAVHRRVVVVAAAAIAILAVSLPRAASAEGLFDFFFGGGPQKQQQSGPSPSNFFTDPFGLNQQQPAAPAPRVATGNSGRGTAYCVRSCDGKYFPISTRGGATPAQVCQSFCPAAQTRVFSGGTIDNAVASNGERYADSANAYAYRKALKADCTCNGRDPAGLAHIDLAQDTSLRSGDVVATTDGLVAYTGVRLGAGQAPDFSPVADYPGLTAGIRAKLGEMKVAPQNAELMADGAPPAEPGRIAPPPAPATHAATKSKHSVVN